MRFVFGNCMLDTERYELRRAGQLVALEPRAFRVLAYLLQHAGRAVAKHDLVQACWPNPSSESISQEYALRNCLMKIRQAVGEPGTPQAVIETVRGYGYRVTAAVTVLPPEGLAAGPCCRTRHTARRYLLPVCPPGLSRDGVSSLCCAPPWWRISPGCGGMPRMSGQSSRRFIPPVKR
jgi:DNA-binding winged helix-turn-helix (wHTH) protein